MSANKKSISLVVTLTLIVLSFVGLWFFNKENIKEENPTKEVQESFESSDIGNLEEIFDIKVEENVGERIVIFHNRYVEDEEGQGSLYDEVSQESKDALGFVRVMSYPVDEYIYSRGEAKSRFLALIDFYEKSEGKSENFGYFPVIFVKDRAFSGFDEEIEKEIYDIIYPPEKNEGEAEKEVKRK